MEWDFKKNNISEYYSDINTELAKYFRIEDEVYNLEQSKNINSQEYENISNEKIILGTISNE